MNLEKSVVAKTGFCKPIANPKQVVGSPNDLNAVSAGVISSPNELGSVAKSNLDAPNLITPNAYSDLPPFPDTHGVIQYENDLINSTITSNIGDGSSTVTPNTFDRWVVDSLVAPFAVTDYLLPSNRNVNTFCIGGHNMGGKNLTVSFFTSDTDIPDPANLVGSVVVDNNKPIMFAISDRDVLKVRLLIEGSGGESFYISNVSVGYGLQLQRPVYGGVNPAPLNAVTDYFNNRSESGEWIGRTIRRRGFDSSINMVRITPEWYREYFQPFVESAKTTPFFYSWRPGDYPEDVVYCWTESDIKPSNSGKREFMNLSFPIKCHGYE